MHVVVWCTLARPSAGARTVVRSEDEAIMFHVKHDRLNFAGKSYSLVRAAPICFG